MRIAVIGPPFIAIPPKAYGGTELFIAHLAGELHQLGHEVVVYGNGESKLPCEVRWRYPRGDWPPDGSQRQALMYGDHLGWAVHEASLWADVVHVNDPLALPYTRYVARPTLLTMHSPHEEDTSALFARYPEIDYVAIARWLAEREQMPKVHVVHHGLPLGQYEFSAKKDDYLVFLGRMAPCKGPHVAIDAAKKAGLPIKLAGEIQPAYRDYWETEVLPRIDGVQAQFVGEADLAMKNELLKHARALLFPIDWEEPFGLVMIEAMACGTPVLAYPGGAVEEIVEDGVSGWICHDLEQLAGRSVTPGIRPEACRDHVERHFSATRMAEGYLSIYRQLLTGSGLTGVASWTT
ncbi:MAG: glycosyltransferase family 4 protein [Myxococcaceae bacterium]